ncbi:FG-GAP-like repeat-containing protein [Streptomyces sp. LP05-1]|uniref:FG-GAP-like repeat-containing protein n=1 Tax=Streptomyces pyxinae TaxID=2970734 RepID=A0ABT2CDS6_9ACTN|nr:FG-GAP-like repeat-containing protein [Streptomyces sp. LP05-1]MCS0635568.1 FG-GAP-like repeat-containing protein [Streptomyces sp. LP05-1]
MRVSPLRRLATLATTLGLTSLGLLGAGAAPAQAAIKDCPAGYFCAWKTDNGTGTMFKTNTDKATLGAWDNTFRSVVNHTSKFACLYDDPKHGPAGSVSVWDPDPKGTEWGHSGGTVSSLRLVPTSRECVLPVYPRWYSSVAPRAAGFGDLDADRRADVLVRDKAGRLWFLPGDTTGKLVGTGGWNAFDSLVRHGDFTGDGREDVLAREASTGKLWLYSGTGTGSLGARKLLGGGWNAMSRIVGAGDLTGDGRADVLAVEKSTGKLWLYPGTATGGLGVRKLLGSGGWNGINALVGAGDMNGDGRADLIAREASTGKLWLYPGKAGSLGPRVLSGSGSGWKLMDTFLGVGDVNGDGRADLVTTTTSDFVSPECRGVGCQLVHTGRGNGALEPGVVVDTDWWDLNGLF